MGRGLSDSSMTRRGALAGLAWAPWLAGCSGQSDLAAGEQGRVMRVLDGDVLALETGLRVRLAEIEAPAPGYGERVGEPWAEEARGVLAAAAVGRQAQLWYGGLSRDGYERALAHVIVRDEVGGEIWLNGMLARQGAARVRTYPDNARRARALLALEAEAREAVRGLWAEAHWRVRGLDDLEDAPNFAIVAGEIASVGAMAGDGEAWLSAGGIRFEVGERLGVADVQIAAGRRVRVRGRIDRRDGAPKIRVTHWAQVEAA